MKLLAVIVPVLDEQTTIRELAERIAATLRQRAWEFEILFVDDGSKDDSWNQIQQLSRDCTYVQGLRMRRNFGKAAALMAGIEASQAKYIATIDADLQDEPSEIPRLIDELEKGFDVVSGWKQTRQDPWHKTWPSRCFNLLTSLLTGVRLHDHNCGLKVYRREVFDEVKLYGEMHRFVPVLAAARGWRISEVAVTHHARRHGRSKYGVTRFAKGFLDLLTVYFLTSFRQRPQHLLGTVGLASLGLGGLVLGYLTLVWVATRVLPGFEPEDLHERALFYYAILGILLGVQLLSIGFLAELIIAAHRPGVPTYSIAESTMANMEEHDGLSRSKGRIEEER